MPRDIEATRKAKREHMARKRAADPDAEFFALCQDVVERIARQHALLRVLEAA